jgi:ribosome-associated protein
VENWTFTPNGARIEDATTREVPIRGEVIRLGQLLKLTGTVEAGGDVRGFLAANAVTVNGEPEDRRGRQLRPGDEVRVGDDVIRVAR